MIDPGQDMMTKRIMPESDLRISTASEWNTFWRLKLSTDKIMSPDRSFLERAALELGITDLMKMRSKFESLPPDIVRPKYSLASL